MNDVLEHTDRHIAGTDDQVHHHGPAIPGTVSLALCGARRVAMPPDRALELPCCPDCAALLDVPCNTGASL